jgi:hypothetical protein
MRQRFHHALALVQHHIEDTVGNTLFAQVKDFVRIQIIGRS